ncbi:MAG: hypothetical protein R2855_02585 [Thermomicrobiales bacterium]
MTKPPVSGRNHQKRRHHHVGTFDLHDVALHAFGDLEFVQGAQLAEGEYPAANALLPGPFIDARETNGFVIDQLVHPFSAGAGAGEAGIAISAGWS